MLIETVQRRIRNSPGGDVVKNLVVRGVVVASFGASLVLFLDSPAVAQGSGSSRLNQPPPANSARPAPANAQPAPTYVQPQPRVARPQTPEEFQEALWRYLAGSQSPYTHWAPLPDKAGLRKGASPHGAFVRLYANGVAAADPKGLPYGSIVVLEDYTADQKARTGINILYRVKGYDPKNGDWYWMKYNENGSVVRTSPQEGGQPIAGRALACIECHRKAGGNDFVFSNDPAAGQPAPGDKEKGGAERKDRPEEKGQIAPPGGMAFGRDWPAADRIALDAVDHRAWDVLLKRYVDAAGDVDYPAWRRSDRDLRALDDYLDGLSRADTGRASGRAASLAFWINAYNALTARAVLSSYGGGDVIPSHGGDAGGAPLLRVGDRAYTADRIENEILRGLGESRVHFAIVCGARGCPPLRSEAYSPERLDEQLTANARAFFADPSKFRAHTAEDRLELSPILDWYAADFGADPVARLKAIAPYLPDEPSRRLAASGRARISHLDYDARLNESTGPRPTQGSPGDGGR
jgi:hypothetical protein